MVGGGVFDLVERTVALFGGVIQDFGRGTVAGSLGGGDGSWGAAYFVGSCFCGASWADALEEMFVKDHAFGTARQLTGLVVIETESLGEGQEGEKDNSCFVHDLNYYSPSPAYLTNFYFMNKFKRYLEETHLAFLLLFPAF